MSVFSQLMMRKKEQTMYATIKGTLTESPSGVFSGFSNSNYLQLQQQFTLSPTTKAEFCFKINVSNFDTTFNNVFYGNKKQRYFYFGVQTNGKLIISFADGGADWISLQSSNTALSLNTDYIIKIKIDNNVASIYINGTLDKTYKIGLSATNTINVGIGSGLTSSDYFRGSIDLPNSYVKLGTTKYNLQAVVGYTVVGSPTINDGVVSGFSNSDYLKLPSFDYANSNNWEMIVAFELDNLNSDTQTLFDNSASKSGLYIYLTNQQKILLYGSDGTNNIFSVTSNALSINQKYYIKIKFTGTSYIFYLSTDKVNWTIINTVETTVKMNNVTNFSVGYSMRYSSRALADGKIYIAETIIYKDNKIWFNGYEG